MPKKVKVCRICMLGNTKGVISLFTLYNGSVKIYTKIMEVANTQISETDGLPGWICYCCLVQLETSYQFKIQAEKSDFLFRTQLDKAIPSDGESNHDEQKLTSDDNNHCVEDNFSPAQCKEGKSSSTCDIKSCTQHEDRFSGNECINEQNNKEFKGDVCIEQLNTLKISSRTEIQSSDSGRNNHDIIVTSNKLRHALEKTYNCEVCFNSYTTEKQLNDHLVIHSSTNTNFVSKHQLKARELVYLDLNQQKNENDKTFPRKESGEARLSTHHGLPFKCNTCDYTSFKNLNVKRHMLIHSGEKPFRCRLCSQSFRYGHSLNHHMLKHSGVKIFKCDLCERAFLKEERLISHKCNLCVREYSCKYCDKKFKKRSPFYSHLASHKSPFHCDICSKEFQSKTGLIRHKENSHSGEEPKYVCEICGKPFMVLQYLNAHKIMHSIGNPLECDICNKKFPHTRALKVHRKFVHLTKGILHPCQICGKNFKHLCSLKKHTKTTHSNGEKYNCEICPATFTQKSALNTHTKIIHLGLEPFSCKFCGQNFKWKQAFNKHKIKCTEPV